MSVKYDFRPFGESVQTMIACEIERVMRHGYGKAEAAVLVAQVTMSSAVGFTAGAMGKRPPTANEVGEFTKQVIHLVAEMPPAEASCQFCGLPIRVHPRCDKCGYTYCDANAHGDHDLCGEQTPDKPKG